MSDVFDTCESNFLKNIRFVQKALQETDESNTKIAEMNECLTDATQ
jgi:formylmethanofuran dehydrogenase subunit E